MLTLSRRLALNAQSRVTGSPLTPVAGMKAWYDAADTSTIIQSGGLVSQHNDKSGNGYHATQATGASQPSTGVSTINGKNVISYDGLNDFMNLPAGLYGLSSGNNTIFMVVRRSNSASARFINGGVAGATRYGIYFNTVNSTLVGICNAAFVSTTVPIDNNVAPHLEQLKVSGTVMSLSHDGGAYVTTTASSVTVDSLRLGASPANTEFIRGDIAEFIAYDTTLSNAEITQNNNYLFSKWGIPNNSNVFLAYTGDSRTVGVGGTGQEMPSRIEPSISPIPISHNSAVAGRQTGTAVSNYSSEIVSRFKTGKKNINIVDGFGINDFRLDVLFETVRDNYIAMANAGHAAGYKMMTTTIPPRNTNTAPQNVELAKMNAWIMSTGSAYFDAIVDINSNPNIGTWNATYYSDETHLNDAGQNMWAAMMVTPLQNLINSM